MFQFDSGKCTDCGACTVACMDSHDPDMTKKAAYRRITKTESLKNGELLIAYKSTACMHCEKPRCVESCPNGCLKKDVETGLVLFDKGRCTGCQSCAKACPFNAIFFDESGVPLKCDGCYDRVAAGYNPVCVNACPTKAIIWNGNERQSKV